MKMLPDDVMQFLDEMEVTQGADREAKIREAAAIAALDGRPHLYVAWLPVRAFERLYRDEGANGPVHVINVEVYLPPWARGYSRVLLAEKQIRDAIGDE